VGAFAVLGLFALLVGIGTLSQPATAGSPRPPDSIHKGERRQSPHVKKRLQINGNL